MLLPFWRQCHWVCAAVANIFLCFHLRSRLPSQSHSGGNTFGSLDGIFDCLLLIVPCEIVGGPGLFFLLEPIRPMGSGHGAGHGGPCTYICIHVTWCMYRGTERETECESRETKREINEPISCPCLWLVASASRTAFRTSVLLRICEMLCKTRF